MTAITVPAAPGGVRGRLRVPGDKSISHRALLIAARSEGRSEIRGLSDGADVAATQAAVQAFGAEVHIDGDVLTISGGARTLHEPETVIDVGNSGTGIRLMAGWSAAVEGLTILQGDRSVAGRPMGRVVEPLREMGAAVDGRAGGALPPLVVRGGGLHGIDYTVPVPSAQVKGAVLLAALGAEGPTTVRERVATRAHTEEMLAASGADIAVQAGSVVLRPGKLEGRHFDVPGDPSQAAFWIVAACVTPGSDLTIEGIYVGPQRAAFLEVLQRMGAAIDVTRHADGTTADVRARFSPLRGSEVGGSEVPGLIDEIPVLAVAAAQAAGHTTFRDAGELRVKESDRVATTVAALRALGVEAEPLPDGLAVNGRSGKPFDGGSIDAAGDHRIAMAGAVAALVASAPVDIEAWDAVATSYPRFLEDLERIRS